MFEDMLAYHPENPLNRRFAELLAADLDDDARQFYVRMAADIEAAAARTGWAADPAAVVQTLLEAVVAAPAARGARWRRLHRQIGVLIAGWPLDNASDDAAGPAVARLRAFLRENADLADPPPFAALERALFAGSAGL
jgi:hypothetical protein